MRKLSAVAIGGSNTVMRPGYLTELPRCLERHGIALDLKANLAVGNTTILNGLINLKSREDALKGSDVLLIEYTLNDTSAFAGRDEVRLPICAILHTGKLKGLRTVVAQEDKVARA